MSDAPAWRGRIDDATAWTARAVVAAGVPLFLREAGRGDPILLLHGFPQSGQCWREVAARLAVRHRVLVPDLPGYGGSGRPPAYHAETVAGVLVALLDEAGAPQATVVGHDWGGSLAFALALSHPEHVRRLVVTNAPFRKLDLRRGFHFLAFNLPLVPEVAFRLAGDRIVAWILRAGSARKEVFGEAAVRPYQEAFRDPSKVSSALAYYRTITRRIIARRLRRAPSRSGAARPARRIDAPTLIVWGMRDPALPPALLDGIASDIPHARIVRIVGAGHFVPEEAPAELAAAIESFLASG